MRFVKPRRVKVWLSPDPSTSNRTVGFPEYGYPVCFTMRHYRYVFLGRLIEPVLKNLERFQSSYPLLGGIEYSCSLNGHAQSKDPSLLKGCAVPSLTDTIILSDFLQCFAGPFPYGYRPGYHYLTTSRGMFMDTARSPELSNMSFVPCSWQDTGNADTSLQFIEVSVTAFSLKRQDRPFHSGLTVLYSIRFRCSLELCRRHNFTPPITETHVCFATQAYCKFLLSDLH